MERSVKACVSLPSQNGSSESGPGDFQAACPIQSDPSCPLRPSPRDISEENPAIQNPRLKEAPQSEARTARMVGVKFSKQNQNAFIIRNFSPSSLADSSTKALTNAFSADVPPSISSAVLECSDSSRIKARNRPSSRVRRHFRSDGQPLHSIPRTDRFHRGIFFRYQRRHFLCP